MAPKKDGTSLALETATEQQTEDREVYLSRGRTLAVRTEAGDEVLEVRASSGAVEIRIRLTEEGPVMQVEAVRLEVKAAEAIDLKCKTFSVDASESVAVASQGELAIHSEQDMKIDSTKDVRVVGEKIYLN